MSGLICKLLSSRPFIPFQTWLKHNRYLAKYVFFLLYSHAACYCRIFILKLVSFIVFFYVFEPKKSMKQWSCVVIPYCHIIITIITTWCSYPRFELKCFKCVEHFAWCDTDADPWSPLWLCSEYLWLNVNTLFKSHYFHSDFLAHTDCEHHIRLPFTTTDPLWNDYRAEAQLESNICVIIGR